MGLSPEEVGRRGSGEGEEGAPGGAVPGAPLATGGGGKADLGGKEGGKRGKVKKKKMKYFTPGHKLKLRRMENNENFCLIDKKSLNLINKNEYFREQKVMDTMC